MSHSMYSSIEERDAQEAGLAEAERQAEARREGCGCQEPDCPDCYPYADLKCNECKTLNCTVCGITGTPVDEQGQLIKLSDIFDLEGFDCPF